MLNRVLLCGRLGKDPVIRATKKDQHVCTVSLAVDRDGNRQMMNKSADWINVVFYDRNCDNVVKYCAKGSQILVDGRLTERTYDDIHGKEQHVVEVVVDRFYFMGEKKKKAGAPNISASDDESELPF